MLVELSQRAGDESTNQALSLFSGKRKLVLRMYWSLHAGKGVYLPEGGYYKKQYHLHDDEIEYDPETGERR